MTVGDRAVYPSLAAMIAECVAEFDRIPDDRRGRLREITSFVRAHAGSGGTTLLVFICSHNSRRSQMAQIWSWTAALYFGVPNVETFSGGTEATAFDPRAVAALRRAGFRIERDSDRENPIYRVRYHDRAGPLECFSKLFHQPPNPNQAFAAVMTCSAADQACPIVPGATGRISIPYDDPGAFDGTDGETAAYDERCRHIARDMLYALSPLAR